MKRICWILAICGLSFTMAFSQDDTFYKSDSGAAKNTHSDNDEGQGHVVPPANYRTNNDNHVYLDNNAANDEEHVINPTAHTASVSPDNSFYDVNADTKSYNNTPAAVVPTPSDNSVYTNNGNAVVNPVPANVATGNVTASVNSNNNEPVTPAPAGNAPVVSDNNNYNSGSNYNNAPTSHQPNVNSGPDGTTYYDSNDGATNTIPPPAYNDPNNYNNTGGNGNYYANSSSDPNGQTYTNAGTDNNGNNTGGYYANNSTDNQTYNNGGSTPDYQTFHDQLSPYGTWVNYPGYGNVWVPNQVPTGFSPYVTGGHWVYTNYGWTWASDYAWGWAPFHYGRWIDDNTYGWMWVPGYKWSPACVSWGYYGNYYCWAPLAPYGYFAGSYRPAYYWNFVDRAHFCEGNLGFYMANRAIYGRGDYRGVYAGIHVITDAHVMGNRSYYSGPRAGEVARATGRNITAVGINNVNHAVAPHFNGGQVHNQTAYNHGGASTQQANHYAGSNAQRSTVYGSNNGYAAHTNYGSQYQRPSGQSMSAQRYSQPSAQNHATQNYRGQQRSYQRSQPVQRQSERTYASAQRPAYHSSYSGAARSTGGGSGAHSSARSSGSRSGGGSGHGGRR